ncbi:MAG TPA: class I adenylate-forming enzyme family protein [Mycobacteriales bacterium]|nr:class I adenylate-forming enzyme family protein [Mycobacteriales bacterium]
MSDRSENIPEGSPFVTSTLPADVAGSPLSGHFERLADLMHAVAEQFPDNDALITQDETLTFGMWWRAAGGAAELFAERGVTPGDVVMFLLPTSVDYAIATAGAIRAGAIPTGLNTRLGKGEISGIIDHAKPAIIVVDPKLAEKLPDPAPTGVVTRAELAERAGRGGDPALPDVSPDDPAVIVWTSGTTGLPKGAWFSHRRLKGVATKAGDMARAFDRRLSSTPFVHAGFMTRLWEQFGFVLALTVTPEPWDARKVLQTLSTQRITSAGGVPTQWVKLLQLPELDTLDLSTLRVATTSTAPASPELIEEIQRRFGVPVICRYASTEIATGTGTRVDDPPEVAFRTVGRPQEGVEVSVVADDGGPAAEGEVGRVRIRHDACMNGYWKDPVRTAETITPDGWVITGDLGRIDENGNLVLAGRKSDMYIRGGYNVYPLEVENVLSIHPKVEQVAVLGAQTPVIGEIGVAVVVPADAADPPTLEELRAWSKGYLADYKAPDELRLTDALPRNAALKVDRPALRAWLEGIRDGEGRS